mmetsp:Transcript_1741/g.4175  ORF Transcript_1741/g.4175 Transcript_1741/m.4175 type:complete len:145 (-) Transcript_1741:8-442(-)
MVCGAIDGDLGGCYAHQGGGAPAGEMEEPQHKWEQQATTSDAYGRWPEIRLAMEQCKSCSCLVVPRVSEPRFTCHLVGQTVICLIDICAFFLSILVRFWYCGYGCTIRVFSGLSGEDFSGRVVLSGFRHAVRGTADEFEYFNAG